MKLDELEAELRRKLKEIERRKQRLKELEEGPNGSISVRLSMRWKLRRGRKPKQLFKGLRKSEEK